MQLGQPEIVIDVTQMFMAVYNPDEFLSDDFAAEGLIHLYGKTEDLIQCTSEHCCLVSW